MAADWSWLPLEIFSKIFDRLSLVDRVSCRCICRSWRRAAQEKPILRPPPESPWLMFADPNKGCNFYSVADNKSYHMDMDLLPDVRKHMWIGSSDGWLITVDEQSELHLLNPITRVHIPLPSILSLPSITGVRDSEGNLISYLFSDDLLKVSLEQTRGYLFSMCKAAVTWSDENSWTVMLSFMPRSRLAYAKTGDDAWTIVDHGFWDDLILHDGLFYALMSHQTGYIVEIWDLTSPHPSPVRTEIENDIDDGLRSFYPYLAISSPSAGKQLLLVQRERDHFEYDDKYWTRSFEVYTLDNDGKKPRWVRIHSLGDQALFIGSNSCRSLSTQDCSKLKKNCIYFADDNWEGAPNIPEETRDIGVFNLEGGTIAPCYPEDITKLNWPPPVWITPRIC